MPFDDGNGYPGDAPMDQPVDQFNQDPINADGMQSDFQQQQMEQQQQVEDLFQQDAQLDEQQQQQPITATQADLFGDPMPLGTMQQGSGYTLVYSGDGQDQQEQYHDDPNNPAPGQMMNTAAPTDVASDEWDT